ncbi:potassium-transporting ATPase subunit KdpC [Plantibacter sp. Mn2098]|uniref:potassium-transporting ATPase subunit KdpC n=1 Tax=Plantibacter sp. Mn2098 TaxID=3395266 RepID=UPI003BC88391
MTTSRGILRQLGVATRTMLLFTLVLGVGYTLVITGVGQVAFGAQANGSLVSQDGHVVGSSLIGQSFTDKQGAALPQWFQSRPSAAGTGYDSTTSGGSNLGPNSKVLLGDIQARAAAIASDDDVSPSAIPSDALTASGSGLDPDISVAYAQLQAQRIATARGLDVSKVDALITSKIQGRDLGFLGEPRVNVLALNLALAKMGD